MHITAGTSACSVEYVVLSTQAQDNALIVAACSAMNCDSKASNIDAIDHLPTKMVGGRWQFFTGVIGDENGGHILGARRWRVEDGG